MKKFLQNKKLSSTFIVIIVIFTVLGGSVSLRNKRNAPLLVQSLGNDIVALGTRIVDVPVGFISGGLNSAHEILNAQDENNHLKRQITNLGQTKVRNASLEKENRQLKAGLNLKDTLSGYTLINASVISRAPDTWSDLLTINKGSSSGIKKNMAVMCGGGVIGRIVEADAASSKVELITTTDESANRFSVQADAANGKTVHGIITVTANNQLAFTQVVDGRKLKAGTKVYTSGMGGNSPKGLLIGTVTQTTRDSFGLSDQIRIKPAGDISDPSVVTVIERQVAN
ncbi:rod shape-determining protein MreC [Lactobacillus helveticus]|uniref:Cell shape-determining protein MreC n=1 Tax=Lactobacillus helveticus TaxID=1587 RepID=A0A3Q8STT2_LACHE|nr:rod shape-determining protein MreC [Lactobacillus helveticus]AFR22325.1 rod shape-determining protein MreC [Lactobacillus helveticus R0052]AZK90982.1 Cell shape-determining protein MreC precursor [Lactobacillus helveticus]MCJ2190660.1 rod shape-determining protein MreC [Lactobacillus helveticus]MED7627775.1 rod shape-determining protein MreC [Lactobacillus helveticus]MZR05363.1 rod shape-determining protein MreC [Lactobacillus helveticus]